MNEPRLVASKEIGANSRSMNPVREIISINLQVKKIEVEALHRSVFSYEYINNSEPSFVLMCLNGSFAFEENSKFSYFSYN